MLYFAAQLSDNIAKTDEGYLICKAVPVARTGTQPYLPEELGLPPGSAPIEVYRPPEEVFSAATVASFEGKPVTNDHPMAPEGVDTSNIRFLQCGHAQNVRRGEGENSSFLLADLVITDPDTIDRVLHGKREISCGYTYSLENENGRWIQRAIRGNHIAIVDEGRAGPRVAIRDRRPFSVAPKSKSERRNPQMNLNKTIRQTVAAALRANDLSPEELSGVAELMQVALQSPEVLPEAAQAAEAVQTVENAAETAAPAAPAACPLNRTPEFASTAPAPTACSLNRAPESAGAASDEAPSALEALISRIDRLLAVLEAAPAADARGRSCDLDPEGEALVESLLTEDENDPRNGEETPVPEIPFPEGESAFLSEPDPALSSVPADRITPLEAETAGNAAALPASAPETLCGLPENGTAAALPASASETASGLPENGTAAALYDPETGTLLSTAENREATDAMLRSAIRMIKPILAKLPVSARKPAADAAAQALRASRARLASAPASPGLYSALASAPRRSADPRDLGRRIMQSRNVNYKG